MLTINPQFAALRDMNGYTSDSALDKEYFHVEGKKFLKDLAREIGIPDGSYDIRSNKGGAAVSGEVTLHADHLYVQLSEQIGRNGVTILFRSCKNRGDYTGGQNFYESLPLLEMSTLETNEFVMRLRSLGGY